MKRIFLIYIFMGACITLHSQYSPLRFNVEVDPQFAWLSSDDESVTPDGSIFHMHAGLNMDYFFGENYAFVLGLGINNIGGNLLYSDSTAFSSKGEVLWVEPGQSAKLNLQYVDIPVGLKLKTEELGYTTLFLQLGFNPMIILNAKGSSDDADFHKEDIRESINLFGLGYHAGLGVEYTLGGSTALIGGLRWSAGLTDVTDNDNANVKPNVITIHLGVLF